MKSRAICLSVSKRNRKVLDIIEDFELEFDMPKSQTIFKIVEDYYHIRCLEALKK
jgi:hypothetical protein